MLTAAFLALVAVLLWPGRRGEGPRFDHGGRPGAALGGSAVPWGAGVGRPRTAALHGAAVRSWLRGVCQTTGDDTWVADVAEVVAVGLEAGLDLPRAVRAAARSPTVRVSAPWLEARVAESLASGGAVWACLDPPGHPASGPRGDVDLLASSWRLAEETGSPASAVTAAAAEAVRERRASRDRATVAVAGPRTSMWLLTGLPVAGPLGAALVGLGPDRLYATPGARAAAAAGLVLTALGWLWARRLLGRAARPATTGTAPATRGHGSGGEREPAPAGPRRARRPNRSDRAGRRGRRWLRRAAVRS